jgi:hypothetical protein
MSTFICPGYEGHPCGKTVERASPNHKRCKECSQEEMKAYEAARKDKKKACFAAYSIAHTEERSVRSHHFSIFGTKNRSAAKNYEGMPFEDAWNPKMGGSFKAGGEWIIANLGKRPEGCWLHIVDHEKGFVPGNLEWTHPKKQVAEQMFKIIARQRHEIKELQIENQKLRAEIQETKTRAA